MGFSRSMETAVTVHCQLVSQRVEHTIEEEVEKIEFYVPETVYEILS